MAFRLEDRWVWDFWFAQEDRLTHMFFLNAPKAIGDPEQRHWNVSIGHALSTDLVNWTECGTALGPTRSPAWDDYTTWTGSVVRTPQQRWMMFYTGTNHAGRGLVQRIGAAVSDDLHTWKRLAHNPILDINPSWYEPLDTDVWHDQAFRDPWVFAAPNGDGWHMVFTAREPMGPAIGRGVLGHAVSHDLEHWSLRPPLFRSKVFGQLEVPQIFEHQGRWYCLFCTAKNHIEPAYCRERMSEPMTGTHYLIADHPLGEWKLVEEDFLVGDAAGSLYSGRVVHASDGTLRFMAFLKFGKDGQFIGEISDPMPVHVLDNGRLQVDASRYEVDGSDRLAGKRQDRDSR
ncbi:hypothetical protein AB3X86_36170 [Paraburkholderia sp. BR14374]